MACIIHAQLTSLNFETLSRKSIRKFGLLFCFPRLLTPSAAIFPDSTLLFLQQLHPEYKRITEVKSKGR